MDCPHARIAITRGTGMMKYSVEHAREIVAHQGICRDCGESLEMWEGSGSKSDLYQPDEKDGWTFTAASTPQENDDGEQQG
jgi:hypothetical protein